MKLFSLGVLATVTGLVVGFCPLVLADETYPTNLWFSV